MEKKSKSGWQQLREYLNSKNVGDLVTRKELVKKLCYYVICENDYPVPNVNLQTMDTLRNSLIRANYLEYIGRGKYKVVKKIPDDLTTTALNILAFGTNLEYLEYKYKSK